MPNSETVHGICHRAQRVEATLAFDVAFDSSS
jgi:hypothetical protein